MKRKKYSIRKFTGLILLFVICMGRDVYAHGWILNVSTPFSSPGGLYWLIPPLFMISFVVVNFILIRRHTDVNEDVGLYRTRIIFRFIVSLLITLVIGNILFFLFTILGGSFPGLGYGRTVLYGFDGPFPLILFAVFNCMAVAIFLRGVRKLSKKYEMPKQKYVKILRPANLLLYAVFLLPYVFTGAFVSGYEGGHISTSCESNIRRLGRGMVMYAKDHKGMLPDHTSIERVAEELYEQENLKRYGSLRENIVCSVEAGYEEDPAVYLWNKQLAGRSIKDLKQMKPLTPVITCRYHLGRDRVILLCVGDLLNAYGKEKEKVEYVDIDLKCQWKWMLNKQDLIERIEGGSQ